MYGKEEGMVYGQDQRQNRICKEGISRVGRHGYFLTEFADLISTKYIGYPMIHHFSSSADMERSERYDFRQLIIPVG